MSLGSLSLRTGQSSSSSYKESISSEDDKSSNSTDLYSELRLIERNEGEINVCWKGAHMMLFFMAFVFGSLCTCSFHRLMSMFDEKCVLFPKVVSRHSIHSIVYEFFSFKPSTRNNDELSMINEPTDYLSTQWADNSVCYLPTFVPLVSGLAGLVCTTMFLMCSSGTSNVTGAQRHWRALPAIFFFSIPMSVICIYSSCLTHSGLQVLCMKMAEATGSTSCSYNINVVTLVYERRIHGVYQATRLCIVAAWLHTGCWVLSTLLVAARVLLAVDFTLVRVKAQLVGNLDDILQKHEKQIHSFNAEAATPLKFDVDEDDSEVELFSTSNAIKGHNHNKTPLDLPKEPTKGDTTSLGPEGRQKILDKYMHTILHDLLKTVGKWDQSTQTKTRLNTNTPEEITDAGHTETLAKEFIKKLCGRLTNEINDFEHQIKSSLENKNIYDNIDNTQHNIKNNDRKKNEATDKELKNIIDNIKYGEIEQGGTISNKEIYATNLEHGTSKKTGGKVKNSEKTEGKDKESEKTEARDMSVEMLSVTKSYDDLRIFKKITKTFKDEKEHERKDEDIELKDTRNKENVDDDNKSAAAKAYDKTETNLQKIEKNTDYTKDGKGSQDIKDNHNKNQEK